MGKVAEKPKTVFDKKTYLEWYDIMLLIRRFEERTLMAYGQNQVRGFCHVYIGQEAIAAGLLTGIRAEDAIVTGYRQHGIALMRGLDPKACMAELFGKATGVVKGKGGSMHFFSKEKRYFGGNGIVGAQIPIGTGIAFAEKYKGTDNLCVTMFGDGAARQGAVFESFNMAATWKLPVLYICENNHYAMGTSVSRTSNVTDIYKIGQAFDMPSEPVDAMVPEEVHMALERAAKHIRSGAGPYFLEFKTYRYKGHSVSDPAKYRSKEELKEYQERDPVKMLEKKILEAGTATAAEIKEVKDRVKKIVEESVAFAEASPFPDPSELYTDNYMQKDFPFTV
ncbi:MAG: pyruvate dehydrogenase (acetyl-transferring) E1 component subunit alpha [Saprospiraceae bacterium]|nr:pyruvate dehydrogenase (acetyl-transferring) E1 component subunit alpha [Saprospiraceae bacterium]